jgi:chemotaxis protein CheX
MTEPKKSLIDVAIINPIINGAIETLKVQCKTEAKALKPLLKSNFSTDKPLDIAGVIGIKSNTFNGSISICFCAPTFLNLMSAMMGETYSEITTDLEDGAGELINIIFGQAKKELHGNGQQIERALPMVIRGSGTTVKAFSKSGETSSIVLPFESSAGPFYLEVSAAIENENH